jgi:hypothetical protein
MSHFVEGPQNETLNQVNLGEPTPAGRALRTVGLTITWFIVTLLSVWALFALYIDLQIAALRIPLTLLYAIGISVILAKSAGRAWAAAALCLVGFCLVATWWFRLKPTNQGSWRSDSDRVAWAEVNGDRVTIHNLRNCEYQTEVEFANCWSDRTVDLSQLRAVDLFLVNWGLRWLDHTIASFQFGDAEHIAFSIEPRYKVGQSYSAIRAFFRQYELIFVAADERDVIRLRTNYRHREQVYMYRARLQPGEARDIFLTYIEYLNHLRGHPEWYNALTRNCQTTTGRKILGASSKPPRWSSRFELNGSFDEVLYNRGRLVTEGLSFPELKQHENINAAAKAAGNSPDFSSVIRIGKVGF